MQEENVAIPLSLFISDLHALYKSVLYKNVEAEICPEDCPNKVPRLNSKSASNPVIYISANYVLYSTN